MDWESGREQLITYIKKYRFLLMILMAGIFVMLFPQSENEPQIPTPVQVSSGTDLQAELAEILSRISGVGRAEVLLTQASGENTIYQTDGDSGLNSLRQNTVILTNSNREEAGLIKQVNAPVYRGAIVVCQGADSASIRLAVVDAVKCVTGLSADCITVLKMK